MKKTTVFTLVLGSGKEMKVTLSADIRSDLEGDLVGFESVAQRCWSAVKSSLDMHVLKSIELVPERGVGIAANDYAGLFHNDLIDAETFEALTGEQPSEVDYVIRDGLDKGRLC